MSLTSTAFAQVRFVNLPCDYKFEDFPYTKNVSSCIVTSNPQFDNENIQVNIVNRYFGSLNGEIFPFNIRGFVIKAKEVYSFPSKIGSTFPNLRVLVINHSKLKAISSAALKSLRQLSHLDLRSNEIIMLESYLFQNNEQLKYIWLSNNKIQYIYPDAFNGLQNLKLVDLTRNVCYSFNSTSIQDLQKIQTGSFCTLEFAEIYEEITKLDELLEFNNRTKINHAQLLDQIRKIPNYSKSEGTNVLECTENSIPQNLVQLIIICALWFAIAILVILIVFCKRSQSDTGRFIEEYNVKKESSGLQSREFVEKDLERYIIDTEMTNFEDVYSEVADYEKDGLQSRCSEDNDEVYSVILESN